MENGVDKMAMAEVVLLVVQVVGLLGRVIVATVVVVTVVALLGIASDLRRRYPATSLSQLHSHLI